MEETTATAGEASQAPPIDIESLYNVNKSDSGVIADSGNSKDESGIVADKSVDAKDTATESEQCEVNDDARSLDLDSLPAADELVLGAAGSDSGVEGCGRALSSGGGSRSCASSVVSCGSGCGSESSSLAGAPPRPKRRVNVTVAEPKRSSPISASTPRPAPRGPNLATRERARSREKPTVPEKPRPLTPKPKIRPTTDLPNLVRESPALRAKPTKTSTARCRTPNSPCEEKRWPAIPPRLSTPGDTSATRMAADKYGTLPRRRREGDSESSPKHESTPPSSRRTTITRSVSSRSTTKTRVRIYAEKVSQTVLLGTDIESALGGVVPNIDRRVDVSVCHRGVQASSRDSELGRLAAVAAAAEETAAEERQRRAHLEEQLAAERSARLAAIAELERNTQRLLELAGAGADANADGCLRALEEQLRSAGQVAAKQRADIDSLRMLCDKLHGDLQVARESARLSGARLAEAEREAAEMQEFLAAETGALGDSLREADAEILRLNADLEKRRAECGQLVRLCEARRHEALGAAATARAAACAGAALDALAAQLRAVTLTLLAGRHRYTRPTTARAAACAGAALDALAAQLRAVTLTLLAGRHSPNVSVEAGSPADPPGGSGAVAGGGLFSLVARARPLLLDDDRSHASEDNDNSADLLDSETEPCLVTDPECAEEWWSGTEGAGAWSADELSPDRETADDKESSQQESLANLSTAIAGRQRSEDERARLRERCALLDARLAELRRAAAAATRREPCEVSDKNMADVIKKLSELDTTKQMLENYKSNIEELKSKYNNCDDDDLELLEEEVSSWSEAERRARYEALDAAAEALARGARAAAGCPRLRRLHLALERLAFAAAAPPPATPAAPLHTTA